ncbi:MAG: helix-turn-helix transcriptional regulator [Clostridia bacterium]|nr:helix-turn-helix transcriptional regulator [Clostridia bacterium]
MVKNLKALRKENKISQQQLADAIGVSQQSVNKYENTGVEPDIAVLIKIADYFSVSIDYLIGRVPAPDFAVSSLTKEEKSVFSRYKLLNRKEKEIVKLVIENHKR